MKTKTLTRNTISLIVLTGFLFAFPFISGSSLYPQSASLPSYIPEQIEWKQYTDERFDFTLDIPANWNIDYRIDKPGTMGETLSFYNNKYIGENEQKRTVITIGHYMYENDSGLSLAQWTDLYEENLNSISTPSQAMWFEQKDLQTIQWAGHQRTGETHLGPVVFTNVQNGNIVWFIWSNVDSQYKAVYDHVVDTLKFGKRSPKSLAEIYGAEFKTSSLTIDLQNKFVSDIFARRSNQTASLVTNSISILGSDPFGYRLPFTGMYVITCGPRCCSSHSSLPEAIDYGLPMNTVVKATYNGNVSFFGWKNDTYGNTITIDHGSSRRSQYSHLDYFMVSSLGEYVSKGTSIASSGDTGIGGAHLHFEVSTLGLCEKVDTKNVLIG